jgi:hypothetical protein
VNLAARCDVRMMTISLTNAMDEHAKAVKINIYIYVEGFVPDLRLEHLST